jgi:hypothetical protein
MNICFIVVEHDSFRDLLLYYYKGLLPYLV